MSFKEGLTAAAEGGEYVNRVVWLTRDEETRLKQLAHKHHVTLAVALRAALLYALESQG